MTRREQMVAILPRITGTLRELRDTVNGRRAPMLPTPFGFALAGNPGMAAGGFEPQETQLLKTELTDARLFIDVGANIGFYSCLARSMGVPVLAIEPLPQNLILLLRNLKENNFNDVEVIPVGLAEKPGILTLHGGNTGASLLRGWAGHPAGWERDIAVSTFDRLILPRVPLGKVVIKMDIEGAELNALRGAKELLAHRPSPIWMVEINLNEHHPAGTNPDFVQIFDLFFDSGFRAFVADQSEHELDRGAVAERFRCGDGKVHNYIFRHQ